MTTKKQPKKVYKGVLARPLPPIPKNVLLAAAMVETKCVSITRDGVPLDPSEHEYVKNREALLREQRDEQIRRFFLLFDHYGIDDHTNVLALAWALAEHHVPGMQIMKDRPGAKKKRDMFDDLKIAIALGTFMYERGLKQMTTAARHMHKLEPWSKMAPTWMTLLRRAQAANDSEHRQWMEMLVSSYKSQVGKTPNEKLTFADICAGMGKR